MSTHLLLLNIPKSTNSADVRNFCTGDDISVADAHVRVNAITSRGEGIAFVTFASVDDAARAAQVLSGKSLQGKTPQIRIPTADEVTSFGGVIY